MSRILIVGDQHFKHGLPYAAAFKDGRREEWDTVINAIHETAKSCDAVVLMGDNLNTRHNHSTVLKLFAGFVKKFGDKPIHILVGNHERYGDSTALDFLAEMKLPNVFVYTNMEKVVIGDITAVMVPFHTPGMVGAESWVDATAKATKKLPQGDVAFMHHAISKTKVAGGLTDTFHEIVFDATKLSKKYTYTFSGHIHAPQKVLDNVIVTGSIFASDMGEGQKYIWVYDTSKQEVEQVELPGRVLVKLTDNDKRYAKTPKNAIVKWVITDKKIKRDDIVKKGEKFDVCIISEQYPNERKKIDYGIAGVDLSLENLLKMYAQSQDLEYNDLQEAYALLQASHD